MSYRADKLGDGRTDGQTQATTIPQGQNWPWVKTKIKARFVIMDLWIILGLGSANERRRYIVTSSLIGWAHNLNDPWGCSGEQEAHGAKRWGSNPRSLDPLHRQLNYRDATLPSFLPLRVPCFDSCRHLTATKILLGVIFFNHFADLPRADIRIFQVN